MSCPLAYGWQAHRRRKHALRFGLLALVLIVFLMPLAWTLFASIDIVPNNFLWPPAWSWPPSLDYYIQEIGVAQPGFWMRMLTTAELAVAATALTMFVSFLAAYSLSRSPFRGRRFLVQTFLILGSLPVMAFVIPLSSTVDRMGLRDTFLGVGLAEAAVFTPLAVYILYGYINHVPRDLEDAARLDGAATLRVLGQVVLPVAAAGVVATAVIIFVLNWNSLLVPLILSGNAIKTVPVAMIDFFTPEKDIEWQTAGAALIVSLAPVVIVVGAAHQALEHFVLGPAGEGK